YVSIICKGYYRFSILYCIFILYIFMYRVIICLLRVNYVQSTCTECMSCYVMVGCCAVPCPKNFSAQSDPVLFCASDNKRLVTCNLYSLRFISSPHRLGVLHLRAPLQEISRAG